MTVLRQTDNRQVLVDARDIPSKSEIAATVAHVENLQQRQLATCIVSLRRPHISHIVPPPVCQVRDVDKETVTMERVSSCLPEKERCRTYVKRMKNHTPTTK